MRARSILRRISSLCNGACQGSGASLANSAISSAWGSLDCSNALRRFRAAGLGWRSFQTRRSCIATPLQHSYVTHRALMAAARQFSSGGESIVKISPAAAARLRELQKETPDKEMALRVGIEAGGCSGFQYTFELCSWDEKEPEDIAVEDDGARIIVDSVSVEFVRGATVDFEDELMRSAFIIADNPQAQSSCGCGSSFVAR